MFVVCVTIHVTPEQVEPFVVATLENARYTRLEPGNFQYDVARHEQDPNRFHLYEVYQSAEDFAEHQRTPHYLAWKAQVEGWMAKPRAGERYLRLFPADPPA